MLLVKLLAAGAGTDGNDDPWVLTSAVKFAGFHKGDFERLKVVMLRF